MWESILVEIPVEFSPVEPDHLKTNTEPATHLRAAVLFPCQNKNTMGPRADKHDDVYDRQIRLWGADAQVCVSPTMLVEHSCFF